MTTALNYITQGQAAQVCGVLLCMGLFAGFITCVGDVRNYFARRNRLKQLCNEDQA